MSTFREFPIYKKRDGQSFERVSYIYSDSFENAKKEFAVNMTKDNYHLSNNIQWLDKDTDKVPVTGWYDLDYSSFDYDAEGNPDYTNATHLELICSEDAINEGFDNWSEDVYTWELREED
jgi:hypothetical protein